MNNGIFDGNIVYSNAGFETSDIKSCFSIPSGGLCPNVPTPYYLSDYTNKSNIDYKSLVLVFDTRLSSGTTVTLNFQTTGTFYVDWGDGNVVYYVVNPVGTRSYTYRTHGVYTVQVYAPSYAQIYHINGIGPKLIKILSFGEMNTSNMYLAFNGAPNLIEVPKNLPFGSTPLSLSTLFTNATKLNDANVMYWNTNNITDMTSLFQGHTSFNRDLSYWDVSKCINFSSMFQNATSFNENLNNWQLVAAGGINCTNMFNSATSFTGRGLNTWNTSGVTNMSSMFANATNFSQDLSSWNTSNVTTLNSMFRFTAINSSSSGINNWNVSKVTDFGAVFYGAQVNFPLNNWNTASATNMAQTFSNNLVFNQDLSTWNTSGVTSMMEMFSAARAFNNGGSSSISGWNTSNVTSMVGMFQNANAFNQPINTWNVSKVNSMYYMFQNATVFNQPIDTWNLAGFNAQNALTLFMNGKTGTSAYSTTNYNALLIGWNNNKLLSANGVANWRTDLTPDFGGAKYTAGGAAATARAALVSYGWTITDGGSI